MSVAGTGPHRPKVSVCIPCYDEPAAFRRALESVVSQDYGDYEVIVTDDSPGEAVRETLSGLPLPARFTYVKNAARQGSPANWNEAIGRASGEYIKILHHDDWLLGPDSLRRFVDLLETRPGVPLAFSAAAAYDTRQRLQFVHTPPRERLRELRRGGGCLFFGNFIGPPSSVIYRNRGGLFFDTKLQWLVDVEFYLRLLNSRPDFAYCETPLVGVTVQGSRQLSRSCENNRNLQLFEYLYLYEKLPRRGRQRLRALRFFEQLFRKFNVTSVRELNELLPGRRLPLHLRALVMVRGMLH